LPEDWGFPFSRWRTPARPDQYFSFIFDIGGQQPTMAIGKGNKLTLPNVETS